MNNLLIKDVENKMTKVERKGRKIKRNIYRGFKSPLTIVILILLGMLLAIYVFYKLTTWTNSHKFMWHSPVEVKVNFFTPLKIVSDKPVNKPKKVIVTPVKADEPRKATVTPTPRLKTEKETVLAMKHGEVLWKIYGLESTWGKNDGCRINKRGYAGFGVMFKGEVICYETFTKATERAEHWLTQMGVDKDLASALCLWNTGVKQPMCNYSIAYNSL